MGTTGAWGVAADHLPGLYALLLSPLAIWLLLHGVQWRARWGNQLCGRFLVRYRAASLPIWAASWLMLTTGFIHLALVPSHWVEEPGTALLFVLDGVLFLVASIGIVGSDWWRRAAALLCLATMLAYLLYLVTGREDLDQLGMATKLIELAAFGLLLLPRRARAGSSSSHRRWRPRVTALLALTLLIGSVAWAAAVRAETESTGDMVAAQARDRGNLTGMVTQPVTAGSATPGQIEAAERLAAATKTGIAKYQNVAVAVAAGYRPVTSPGATIVHYSNRAYHDDGHVLDPSRPETLVYANTSHGSVLLGAMYVMPKVGEFGPDAGGPLTPWHVHTGLCFGPLKHARIVGVVSPFGACPAGSINVATPGMLHVWTFNRQEGPYGELSRADLLRIVKH